MVVTHFAQQFDHVVFVSLQPQKLILLIFVEASKARQAQSLTYSPTPIVVAALIYFVLLWPVVRLLSRLENRALAGR